MKILKRFFAYFLCICMLASSDAFVVHAMDDNTAQDNSPNEEYPEVATNTDAATYTDAEEEIKPQTEQRLNWLVVGADYIETPDTQYVLADIGDETGTIERAVLTYINQTTGNTYQQEAAVISGTSAVFYIDHEAAETAIYKVTAIEYVIDAYTYTVSMDEVGIQALYGVNTTVDVEPTAWAVDEDKEDISDVADYIITDSAGNELTPSTFSATLDELDIAEQDAVTASNGNTVIVLSPGHSGSDPGAVRTWNGVTYTERDLTLKIANYCKAELEKHAGITVYMTRYDNTTECTLDGRVEYAKSVNADLYVSIHLNSSTGMTANGAEVHIPTNDYNAEQAALSKELGQAILDKLVALGLSNRGLIMQYNTLGYTNPDGSSADYLAEIRYCKWAGIPGVLVEHAFLSNQSDAETYLGSEEALKKLGVADAQGIIEYLNSRQVTVSCLSGDDSVEITAQYKTDANYQYRFLVYDLSVQQWQMVSDWSTKRTATWKPKKGNYWVRVEVRTTGEMISNNTITYSSTTDYTATYVDLNGFAIQQNTDSISVGAYYKSNDDNVKFQWKAYNLQTKQWELIKGWSAGNWMNWKPQAAPYWLRVEAQLSDGTVESYTSTYTSTKDYRDAYIDLIQFVTIENSDSVSVGVAYNSNVDDVQFQWKAYNLTTKKWEMVQSWSTGNWMTWRPDKGDYWLRVESKSADGTVESNYTEVFTSKRNYNKKYININGICIDERDTVVAAGASYQSNAGNIQFQWKAYNLATKQWEMVQSWSSGNWMNWKPKNNSYWLRVEAKADDGTEENYTIIYSSDIDYTNSYITIDDVEISDNSTSYTLNVNYRTNAKSSSVRWLIYDLTEKTWTTLAPWGGKSTVTWKPEGGNYWVRAEVRTADGLTDFWCEAYDVAKFSIMGNSTIDVQQMMDYYNAYATYPSYYASSDAPTLRDFCRIYLEECEAEGIKAEVAFCQSMKETGFLKFGGAVKIEQFNFAGIGATEAGTPATFSTVREGIRAHVQHLKAYASKGELNNACVDPRFSLVTRGSAPYVEWLGINENPYGVGWATAVNYGYSIKNDYIARLLSY